MKNEVLKNLAYYLALPYTVVLRQDAEGDCVARIDELPGCSSHGSTPAEALENLDEAKRLWIEDALEADHAIPEPAIEELPSGKWLQRVPRSLHKKLSDLAKREGVSFNQLVTSILAEGVGWRQPSMKITSAHLVTGHPLNLWMEVSGEQNWEIDQPAWLGRVVDALSPTISAIPDNREIKVKERASKKELAYEA